MSKRKPGSERLDTNILVPFVGAQADEIKSIANANGVANTIVVRMLIAKALEAVRNGSELKLVVPK